MALKNLHSKPKVLLSRPLYWCWILLLIFSTSAFGQTAYVPVTGFNADIVADGSSLSTPGASTTDYVDGLTTGYVFVSTTFGFGSTFCATTGNALPANNQITSTNTTTATGITYQLQPYGNGTATNSNALRVPTGGSGTLTLVTPINAAVLYLACLGGGGGVTFNATINYADGSSETVVNPVGGAPDWCNGAATYKLTTQKYFRINRTLTACTGDAGDCQYIYEIPVAVGGANYAKNINSVTFNGVTGGILNVMAMGMKAACTAPPAPTGLTFNASTTSTVSGSFTASTATGYLVVSYPTGSTPVAPVAGTTYVPGASLGTGKIVKMDATTTFSAGLLSAATSYDIYVYGYNAGTTCGGPVFTTGALIGTQATIACGAPTLGTVTAGVRTITVGPTGNTATITAALADINTNGINAPTILELQSDYVSTGETFPIVFPASPCTGNTNTLTLRPAAGANGLTITGTNAGPTIDLNGATYVTIDGRPGGVGSTMAVTAAGSTNATNLNIINTNAGGSAIKLDNNANANTVKYCDLQGQNTVGATSPSAIAGVVYFENTGSNGNDNNTISFCNIHSSSASSFPAIGIYSLGTNITTGYSLTSNDNDIVSNCNVYDYFSATSGTNSAGIELNYGNNAWTIINNSFFQTGTRAVTGAYNRGIWLIPWRATGNVGNGFNVSNNYIGGSLPQCGGAPYTLTTSAYFDGIRIEIGDGTTPSASILQNNTISNISITSSTTSDLFHGISTAGGTGLVNILDNNIGTVLGTGGAATGGITLSSSASSVAGHAILLTGTGNYTIQNNTIANILIPTANNYFSGIYTTVNITANINSNTIGSLTEPKSIYFSDATTSGTTGRYIMGMRIAPTGTSSFSINNNTIAGIWSNNIYTGSSGQLVGIYLSSSTANITGGITGNKIKNLYSAARTTGTTTSSAIIGILASATSANVVNVSNNVIDSLIGAGTSGGVNIIGLYATAGTSATNTFARNNIHSIIGDPANASTVIAGIYVAGGTSNYINNMIRLGINPDGSDYTAAASISGINSNTTAANNFYNNTVYIGGAGVGPTATNTFAFRRTATSGTYNILNNILVNNRSNATTGGTHFAVNFASSNAGATLNNNLYNATGTGGVFGYNGTTNVPVYVPGYGATTGWLATDGLSVTGDPQFLLPNGNASTGNLHLNTTVASLAESHAVAVAGVTNDFDGDSRSGYSGTASGSAPDIGADEYAGIYISLNCVGAPTAGTATSTVSAVCPNIAFTLSLTPISSAQGISYQWQSSPASANTWTNLGAAQNTPFYTASTTVSTDYRCVVTCTNANLSDTSIKVSVTANPFNTCYCINSYTTTTSGYLTNFATTGGALNISNPSLNQSGGYQDFTTKVVAGITNTSVAFSATTVGTCHFGMFIDWNQDGDFTDAGETIYLQNSTFTTSFSSSIAVPTTATPGNTRMRLRVNFNGSVLDGCTAIATGETEDYTFNVIAQTPCAGAPAAGNTIASTTSFCVSGSSNLTLTNNYLTSSGIAYQWQSSTNGTTWDNIAGATIAAITSPTITQTTSFRCRLICTAGPDTGYSNPVVVTINPLPAIAISPSQAAFCSAGSATLTASGGSTYTWSPSATLSAATGTTVTASPTVITTYVVTGTDANGCVNTATTTVGPIDAFTPVGTATGSCAANLPVTITATPIAAATGSTEYRLTDTLGVVINDWQAGTTFTVTPTSTGIYRYFLFARNTTCPSNISDTGTVSFYDGFVANVTANNATCANGDGSLLVSGVQGPGGGNPAAIYYSNDFASSTLNSVYAALQGGASITSGYLQITPNSFSQNGGILIKNPNSISRFDSVRFDLSIPQAGGADGLSWSYGDIAYPASPTSYPFESGIGNKLIISFDAYGTSGAGTQGIYLTYGQSNVSGTTVSISTTVTSTMLAYSPNASWTGASNTPVNIYISSDNKLTLKVGVNVIFNAVQLPADYANANRSTWQQIIAGRTGGIAEQHAIDNLGIYYNATTYSYGSSPAHSNTVPSTWQSSSLFPGLSGGDSLDIWVANPTTPNSCNKLLGTFGVTAPVLTSILGSENPSCLGAEDGYALLKVNAAGNYNVSYKKNGGNTITQSGIASDNDGINDYVAVLLGQGVYTNFKVTNALSSCVSNTIAGLTTLIAPAATTVPGISATSGAMNQPGAGTQYYTDASCNLIAGVNSANNLGSVTANLTVSSTPPTSTSGEPFLGRYVDIIPSQNGNLPATLKLYFTAADFFNYNASASVGTGTYPAILSDGSNLRIRAFHGLPSSGTTGPNGTYNAANADILLPTSTVWNTNGFWEVTVYSPNGFSGFFANTNTGNPLNITVGKIAAHNEGSVNIINWDTKTESANSRFIIERSSDGRTFTEIGTMDGKGIAPSEYTYTDTKPFNSVNYYRLILINADGSKEYSKVVTAEVKNGNKFQLNVFPNPASTEVTVSASNVIGKGWIELSDITGRTIVSKSIDGSTTISLSLNGLADGIYIVKYHDDANAQTVKINKK